jgi:hypothetical protein
MCSPCLTPGRAQQQIRLKKSEIVVLRDNIVDIATHYGLDGPVIKSRWGEILCICPYGSGAHPASCKMGTGFFSGGKVRPGRAADH